MSTEHSWTGDVDAGVRRRGGVVANPRVPAPRRVGPALRPHAGRPPARLVRVLLCEDQEVFRLGLRVVLEAQPDMAVVAETAHLPGALAGAGGGTTQVVVGRQGVGGGATLPLLRGLGGGGPGGPGVAGPGGEG